MDRYPGLYGMVEPERIIRAMLRALLASLLLLGDGYVLILASRHVGIYLLLAAAGSTGLAAVVVITVAYRTQLLLIRRSVAAGRYPRREFRRLVPLLAAAALLIVPGFLTDAFGLAFLVRPFGWLIGAAVERQARHRFRELYEYLRLRH